MSIGLTGADDGDGDADAPEADGRPICGGVLIAVVGCVVEMTGVGVAVLDIVAVLDGVGTTTADVGLEVVAVVEDGVGLLVAAFGHMVAVAEPFGAPLAVTKICVAPLGSVTGTVWSVWAGMVAVLGVGAPTDGVEKTSAIPVLLELITRTANFA